jgi:outer membrane protein TolC
MKRWWIFFLLSGSVAMAAGQQSEQGVLSLSLRRAVEIAISPEGNEQIQLSGEALKQAESRSAQARAALLPNVDSSLRYQNQTMNPYSYGLHLIIPEVVGFPISFPKLVGPFDTMDARLTATQNVFDFGSIRRFQASRAGISAAKADIASTEENVAARVARAYLRAIRADADLDTAKANITLSQAVLNLAESQKAAGTATGIEITRARVQLANDQQRLLVAQNTRHSAHLELLRVMDLSLDVELELTDKLGYVPVDPITLERAKELALEERPDLKAQLERENSARLAASAVRMERLPSVYAFGDYGTIGIGFNDARPTRTFGATLRIPVFDGGRMDARRAESASRYRAEKVRTKEIKERIELDVRLALDALRSAEEQVKVSEEGLTLSENELAQAQRRYEAGVAPGLEVTDAQTRLERARDNQTEALYNYNLARIDLGQAMGRVRSSVQ